MITAQSIIDIKKKALTKDIITVDESDLVWKMDRDSYIEVRKLHANNNYLWDILTFEQDHVHGELLDIPIEIVEEKQQPVLCLINNEITNIKIQNVTFNVECRYKGKKWVERIFVSGYQHSDKNFNLDKHIREELQAICETREIFHKELKE